MKCFAHDAGHDIHVEFRTALKAKHFSSESPEENKAYKDSADKLLVDTVQKTGCVVTTLHKVGDKMLKDSKSFQLVLIDEGCQASESETDDKILKNSKSFQLVLIDEGCQASEPETLLAWISNCETALLIVILGDSKQLPPTVKSKNFEYMINPFTAHLMRSYYERMHIRGFPFEGPIGSLLPARSAKMRKRCATNSSSPPCFGIPYTQRRAPALQSFECVINGTCCSPRGLLNTNRLLGESIDVLTDWRWTK